MTLMGRVRVIAIVVVLVIVGLVAVGILRSILTTGNRGVQPAELKSRSETIPRDAVKMTPKTDRSPPVIHSDEWASPIPMLGPINTAGAEDSPFMMPDGETFFFFFTPDVRIPVEKQLIDGVTGIWWTHKIGGTWTEPERIVLSNDVSLDGCEFVQGNVMWFCSVRAGNYREIDIYTAQYRDGRWTDVTNAGKQLNREYELGEFCLTPDGKTLYYGTVAYGHEGKGEIWALERTNGGWEDAHKAANFDDITTPNQPFVSPDGNELWFTGQSTLGYPGPAVFRSIWAGDTWGPPVEIASSFAGEPALDSEGNLYFVHHYFSENGTMIEADIYVAQHKVTQPATQSAKDSSGLEMLAVWSIHSYLGSIDFAVVRRLSVDSWRCSVIVVHDFVDVSLIIGEW